MGLPIPSDLPPVECRCRWSPKLKKQSVVNPERFPTEYTYFCGLGAPPSEVPPISRAGNREWLPESAAPLTHVSLERHSRAALAILLTKGAEVDSLDNDNRTPSRRTLNS